MPDDDSNGVNPSGMVMSLDAEWDVVGNTSGAIVGQEPISLIQLGYTDGTDENNAVQW